MGAERLEPPTPSTVAVVLYLAVAVFVIVPFQHIRHVISNCKETDSQRRTSASVALLDQPAQFSHKGVVAATQRLQFLEQVSLSSAGPGLEQPGQPSR